MFKEQHDRLLVWVLSLICAGLLFGACGGESSRRLTSDATTTSISEDIEMEAGDFPNILDMTKVRGFYVANLLGHLDESLAVARSVDGGTYPVGTLIQLVPQEAMVKRSTGWNPATSDWEFFFLEVSEQGTEIVTRGIEDVENRFGGNCASCHSDAGEQWDFICEHDHGCEPLPIGTDVITVIQEADPRPRN